METFVIRVWTPADPDDPEGGRVLRGLADHVGGGDRAAFRNGAELLVFLKATLEGSKRVTKTQRSGS